MTQVNLSLDTAKCGKSTTRESTPDVGVRIQSSASSEEAEVVDKEIVDQLNRLHVQISGTGKRSFVWALELGEKLSRLKAELDHGQWTKQLVKRLKFPEKTAQRYMKVHRYSNELRGQQIDSLTRAYAYIGRREREKKRATEANAAGCSIELLVYRERVERLEKSVKRLAEAVPSTAPGGVVVHLNQARASISAANGEVKAAAKTDRLSVLPTAPAAVA